ncbi:MAG TPA: acyl-CoA reductase [Candidatus Eisenbacteria bacterium]|nr:acyl-CoA reductase [Candidatus Eisenbacteria bacterium]
MTSAFYLPLGLEEGLETTVQRFGPAHDALELHLPVVTADDLTRWIEVLREARETNLAPLTTPQIIRSLDKVVGRFLDPGDSPRREAIDSLSRSGRFTIPMIERALDDAFQPLARGGITKWLVSELGSVHALDRPVAGASSAILRRAHGPEWMLQIYAGNVPALPVWPMLSAVLLKAALLAKTSAREPLLAPLLARTIAEVDDKLGACLAVVWWKGGSADLDPTAIREAPAVMVFGGEEALAGVSRHAPRGARVVLHGPKVSLAYVERRALRFAGLRALTARAAQDVSLYDQQGCLSPHAFYVERKGEVSPEKFTEVLASALEEASIHLPRGDVPAEEAARIQLLRAQARFEAAGLAAYAPTTVELMDPPPGKAVLGSVGIHGATKVVESSGSTSWTVILEDRARFEPGPAHRTVRVHAVDGPEDVARALRGGSVRYVEALGLEASGPERARLAALFTGIGIPRIAPIGSMQRPTPLGTHGGMRRLLPFVTWSTVEAAPASRVKPSRKSSSTKRAPGRRTSR